jgi:uncharacterized glyoxalase superfamily protein PhnB
MFKPEAPPAAHDLLMILSATPRLIVNDSDAAIDYYRRALGARLGARFVADDGVVVHAELDVGDASFTLATEVREWGLLSPLSVGGSSSLVTLDVVDARAVGAAMVSSGAEVVVPVEDRPYGRCEGRIRDPFGHLWIPSHSLDASPPPGVRRIVPDLSVGTMAVTVDFYQRVLGLEVVMDGDWVVTLSAPDRHPIQLTLIGLDASAPVNPHLSVEVENLDAAWQRVIESGAEIVHPRTVEEWGVERFFVRDPAGNVVNVLCHRNALHRNAL